MGHGHLLSQLSQSRGNTKREPRKNSFDVRVWYQVFPVDLSPGSLEMFAAKQHGGHSKGS